MGKKIFKCGFCDCQVGSQTEANAHHASHLPGGDRHGDMLTQEEEEMLLRREIENQEWGEFDRKHRGSL